MRKRWFRFHPVAYLTLHMFSLLHLNCFCDQVKGEMRAQSLWQGCLHVAAELGMRARAAEKDAGPGRLSVCALRAVSGHVTCMLSGGPTCLQNVPSTLRTGRGRGHRPARGH